MPDVTEIAPDVYRISTYVPEINLQFNQFLIKDEEPLLFHTGMKALFPVVREAVATVIDPSKLRWISFQSLRGGRVWLTQRVVADRAQCAGCV